MLIQHINLVNDYHSSHKRERSDMPKVIEWLNTQLDLISIREATREEQKKDVDLVLTTSKALRTVEVKIRYSDYNDFLIEVVSSHTKNTKGWIYKSKADLLVYIIIKNNKIVSGRIMNFVKLRKWWDTDGWLLNLPEIRGTTKTSRFSYSSINYAVPWSTIPSYCHPEARL